ncbi:hypothetical protein DM558_11080 [Entomomonas moraniae]|uniref:Uncharacterized protein n=1 Tax=Entomomonas moraniae TaxID=2213226 RepID=A0A3S9XFS2_9GAMM|nr:hypothetical protein DM558_11080 [Entomomonas moraniae]
MELIAHGDKRFFKRKKRLYLTYSIADNLLILSRCEDSLLHRCIYCNAPGEKMIGLKAHGFEDIVNAAEVGTYFFLYRLYIF